MGSFRQSCSLYILNSFVTAMLENICSKNENYSPNLKFWKSTYFSCKCVPLEIQNTILTTELEILSPKSKPISHKLRKKQKNIFPKKILCLKTSTGHLLCTFDNLAENFTTNLGIFCSQSNKTSHSSPKNFFFYKVLCRLLQCNFDNPPEILIDNCVKLFCRKPKFNC